MKKSTKKLKNFKKQIMFLLHEKERLVLSIVDSMPSSMIPATYSLVYKTCNNPNCRCKKGHKHGPYPAIQIKQEDKRPLKMIRKEDTSDVKKKVTQYQTYQMTLAKINKINNKINHLLQKERDENLEYYK